MTASTASDVARAVSPEEVAFYRQHGWVKLDSLLAPDVAAEMLRGALDRTGQDRAVPGVHDRAMWSELRFVGRDEKLEPFSSVAFSEAMGRNAQALCGRRQPIRFWSDILACKIPEGEDRASGVTLWHQDLPSQSQDRVGFLTVWIALDEVAPEQGSLRFMTGSHREGPLGRSRAGEPDVLELYRHDVLAGYEMSPPLHLRAGDATVHHGLMVHGAPANSGVRSRWSYILTYFPDDTCYTGAPYSGTDGLGLVVGQPFEHENFPIVYG